MTEPTLTLNDGHKMPMFGLGTWKSPTGAVKDAVLHALKVGYRHIDCASAYANQKEVGAALAEAFAEGVCKREDVFLVSKLAPAEAQADEVEAALRRTLSDLGVAYLDLYLIHWPLRIAKGAAFPFPAESRLGYDPEDYSRVWAAMERVRELGLCRSIGVSNMTVKKLEELLARGVKAVPAVNQVELHPYLAQRELLEYCKGKGIAVTGYSPLGSPDPARASFSAAEPAPLHDAVVAAIATKLGRTPGQVLLRWAVQRGTIVIPKSITPSRIEENLGCLAFELPAEDMAALDDLDKHVRLIRGEVFMPPDFASWKQMWDEE